MEKKGRKRRREKSSHWKDFVNHGKRGFTRRNVLSAGREWAKECPLFERTVLETLSTKKKGGGEGEGRAAGSVDLK